MSDVIKICISTWQGYYGYDADFHNQYKIRCNSWSQKQTEFILEDLSHIKSLFKCRELYGDQAISIFKNGTLMTKEDREEYLFFLGLKINDYNYI